MRNKINAFDVFNAVLMCVILLLVLYPMYFIVIASFSDPNLVNRGEVLLLPKGITFEGYQRVFRETKIWTGYLNTIIYTVLHTVLGLIVTLAAAYSLSRKDFSARNLFMAVFMVTMFFSGGLIPSFLLMQNLHLIDTIWAVVLPGVVSVWNMVVARTYFQTSVPYELQEAAKIDGCSDFKVFYRVVLPLSAPIVAVIALFYAVGMWNQYFGALIYLDSPELFPLQLILREILVQQQLTSQMTTGMAEAMAEQARIADLVKYVLMLVSTLPVMLIYPFIQRYFVKGIMVGAVKG